MGAERLGSLVVDLGMPAVEFGRDVAEAQGIFSDFAHAIGAQIEDLERTVRRVGVGLTAGITAPFAILTTVSTRAAASFETAMGDVHAALRGVDAGTLEQLSDLARQLGPEFNRSAGEAAGGIEKLALAGLNADQILRGAARSTMLLAAANDASLEPAAAAVTDVMAQFGLVTADLPRVVDLITGALDASKLGFDDFQLAISQAGGVAGAAGVSFEDFNTTIAATAPLFGSGSDAGTSFKTFLQRLVPQSEDARRVMAQLGLSFFDAQGRMKGMADIAEELRSKLGNLSEQSRNQALTILFGADAMRTAIGLMGQGRRGFEEMQRTIGDTSAVEKLQIQLSGLEAGWRRLGGAFEAVKIALGEAGLLQLMTALTGAGAALLTGFANLPPIFHTVALVIGAVAAAIGPLMLAVLAIGRLALPLFIGRLGLLGTALVAIINPIGALAALLVRLAVITTGATSALSLFAGGVARVLGPIGLAITALGVLYYALNNYTTASDASRAASDALTTATSAYEEAAMAAASATGEARREALQLAGAKRQEAVETLRAARASLADAYAKLQQARGLAALNAARMRVAAQDPRLIPGAGPRIAQDQIDQAQADINSLEGTIRNAEAAFGRANRIIEAAAAAGAGTQNVSFDAPDRERSRRGRQSDEEDLARRREELRLRQMLDVASARGDVEEERRIQRLVDFTRRKHEYQELGLAAQQAEIAAARDMADLQAARTVGLEREHELAEFRQDLQVAQMRGDTILARMREDELFRAERIAFWRSQELSLAEAQSKAEAELAQIQAAREELRQRATEDEARERQLELSRLRGDSDRTIRARQREIDLERRARQRAERDNIPLDDARDQIRVELDEEDAARLQGTFRETFRDGIRAALDGNFSSWFESWWRDRLTRSLEDALNNIADLLYRLFAEAGAGLGGDGKGGGGIFGSILGAVGSLFGGGAGGGGKIVDMGDFVGKVPKFDTGGQFEVGGLSGPDKNLVTLGLTKGEIVNVKRPDGTAVEEEDAVRVLISLDDDMLTARIVGTSGAVVAELSPTIEKRAQSRTVKGLRRPKLA